MIDEKKLIEELIPILNEHGDMYLSGRIIGLIDSQPKTDWIPCEERLPELDEGMEWFKQSKEYLVTVQWWDKETNVDIGWYNQNGMWSNDSKNCKVIAWLPIALPQPYKKEGAE